MKDLLKVFTLGVLVIFFFIGTALADFQVKNEFAIVTLEKNIEVSKEKDPATEQSVMNELGKEAIKQTLTRIKQDMSYTDYKDKYEIIADRIINNFNIYIKDTHIISKNYVKKKKRFLSRTKYNLNMSIQYTVKKDEIRKKILEDITEGEEIAKYDVYVELYWVNDEEFNPKIVDQVRSNIEKILLNQSFQVISFTGIRDKILEMQSFQDELNALEKKELNEFEKKFKISQISRYQHGLAILAEYVPVLVGVTIKNISVQNNSIIMDLSGEAMLIEGGQRKQIAKSDKHKSVPFEPGLSILLQLAETTAQGLAKDMTIQMRNYFLNHPKIETQRREIYHNRYVLKFENFDNNTFYKIKRKLQDNKNWTFYGADSQKNQIEIEYQGLKDKAADDIYDYLTSNGFNVTVPVYTKDRKYITFSKE